MIRVFFTDGTHEDRPATSPARWAIDAWNFQGSSILDETKGFLYFESGDVLEPKRLQKLQSCRSERVFVWCITGGQAKGETLVGQWVSCDVESMSDQICRLEAELDSARNALRGLIEDCAAVREWRNNKGMGANLHPDFVQCPPSLLHRIERDARRGLGQ